ncbi:MAG: spore coat U domain-containing protein [Candidatus Velthaea sp.]
MNAAKAVLMLAFVLGVTSAAQATQTTGTVQSPGSLTVPIGATVIGNCRVDGQGTNPPGWTLAFGTYQFASALSQNFSTAIYCTKGTKILSVTLGNGLHFANSTRNMADSGGHFLPYKIYTVNCASSPSIEWNAATWPAGFTNATSTSVKAAMGGGPQCGTIPAGATTPAGSYSDTVTVTVNF